MKAVTVVTALVVIGLYSMIGRGGEPVLIRVIVKETPVGRITLGTGWNTWDHWQPQYVPRFRLTWNDAQWDAYLRLLKESGADWVRLDFYYGNTEPRNDNDDPEVINWAAFTFDSPRLRSLYKHLDFFQANGIDVYLVYTYPSRSNHEYNLDKETGWNDKEAVDIKNATGEWPELWTRPKSELADKRELAENLAATTYHLRKKRGYTCIKQVALYIEPNWVLSLDGWGDTIFLGRLLRDLGIRDEVKILAPHVASEYSDYLTPRDADYDIFATEDYAAKVNWKKPWEGLRNLYDYKTLVNSVKSRNPSIEFGLMEYGGSFSTLGADNPLPSYLGTLSSSCLVFEVYNAGFAGVQRWVFEPISHPYMGFAVMKVQGVQYGPIATELSPETTTPILTAMEQGAKVVKVPYTFDPQRLVNTNLRRGSTVYRMLVSDPTPPGKGVCAIAAKDKEGKWHVGLVNLYPDARNVDVVFPSKALPSQLSWDYYDATLPQDSLRGSPPQLSNNTLSLTLKARSLNFLSEP